jgi:hypothetical protein
MTLDINEETSFPPTILNGYLMAQLDLFGITDSTVSQMTPIFPTSPGNIEEVYKNYIDAPNVQDPLFIQYETLARLRTSPFYPKKIEQLVYYVYTTNQTKLINSMRVIKAALDREDASAQDINQWAQENINSRITASFHYTRVFHIDESRDLLELASARTVYKNKIIIQYCYHANDPIESLYN